MRSVLQWRHMSPRWPGRNVAAVAVVAAEARRLPAMMGADAPPATIRSVGVTAAIPTMRMGPVCPCRSMWVPSSHHARWETRPRGFAQQPNTCDRPGTTARLMSSYRRGRGIDMTSFGSLGEMISVVHNNLDIMSNRDISAFWTEVFKHLKRRNAVSLDDNPNAAKQLDDILCHTLEATNTESFSPRDLSQAAIALARIIVKVEDRRGRFRKGSSHQILHDVLISHNSQNKQFILGELAVAAMPMREEFDPRALSNLVYAFGLAKHVLKFDDGSTALDVLAQVALSKLENFNGQDISNMLWAYGNVKASNPQLFKEAGDNIASRGNLESFWPQALANIAWSYATLDETHPALFQKIADHITALDSLGTFNSQDLANISWAYATAKEAHPALFWRVADHIVSLDSLNAFNAQALANIVWAYTTAGESHPKLSKKVGDHIVALDSLNAFDAQNLANTVWAFASAKESHPALFRRVTDHIVSLDSLDAFNPQNFANIVWAYANAKETHSKLFKKITDHIIALDSLESFDAQALSNIVWAFASAKEAHPALFRRVADHIVSLDSLDAFSPQNLANTVWAFASAGEQHPKLFKKIADHIIALGSLESFNPQNLSNIVWAYATLEETHPALFGKVADHIIALDSLQSFNGQDLANTAWAYATAKEANPKLFSKVADASVAKQSELNPQGIANLLWAYATNGQIDQHLFKFFAQTAAALLGQFNEQNLANIAWAYAVADVAAPSLFDEDFINACMAKECNFTAEGLHQLHQWNLWQEELKSNLRLPPPLQQKCYDAFLTRAPSPSGLQDDVISVLSSMGLLPQEEVLTEKGYRLDAVVEVKGSKVGIEVDGPSHFVGRKPTGSTILKHRQVAALEGIPLVSVPYWEWDKLGRRGKKPERKAQYLQSLLGMI